MELQIPRSQRRTLKAIVSHPPETLSQLLAALETIRAGMSVTDATAALVQTGTVDEPEAGGVVRMLAALYAIREREETSSEEMTRHTIAAVEEDDELRPSPQEKLRLEQFLLRALNLDDSIGVTSKAWVLTREYERTYCSSRVLTDLRPVFRIDGDVPAAFVVVHNLKIMFHKGDELDEFFVALKHKDLKDLRKLIDRAIRKEEQLQDAIGELNSVPVMGEVE